MKNLSRIKKGLCAITLFCAASAFSQQDPNRAFFRQTMNLVNPAFAGSADKKGDPNMSRANNSPSEIGIDFRSQWAGVQGAPETQSAFFSTAMGENVGLGVSIINDRTFIESQTAIAVDFSYRLKINAKNNLFLGVKAGGSSYNANLNGLMTFGIGSDPSLANISGRFNPTIGAGALIKGERYFISLSTPNFITSERLQEEDGTARLGQSRAHYYLAAGYDIPMGKSMVLKPAAMLRHIQATPLSLELNLLFSFNQRIELGPSYRFNEGIGGMFIFNAADWVDLGYAYEAAFDSPVAAKSQGSHEIFIKFKM